MLASYTPHFEHLLYEIKSFVWYLVSLTKYKLYKLTAVSLIDPWISISWNRIQILSASKLFLSVCIHIFFRQSLLKTYSLPGSESRLWFFQWSCIDVRVGLWRRLSTEELMLLNCGVGEDSWESLGLQGNPISPFWRRSVLGVLWKDWC